MKLVADCPHCAAHDTVRQSGELRVGDDFIICASFVCSNCGYAAKLNADQLQDELTLAGPDAARALLLKLLAEAHASWKSARRAAGLDL